MKVVLIPPVIKSNTSTRIINGSVPVRVHGESETETVKKKVEPDLDLGLDRE